MSCHSSRVFHLSCRALLVVTLVRSEKLGGRLNPTEIQGPFTRNQMNRFETWKIRHFFSIILLSSGGLGAFERGKKSSRLLPAELQTKNQPQVCIHTSAPAHLRGSVRGPGFKGGPGMKPSLAWDDDHLNDYTFYLFFNVETTARREKLFLL